MHNHVSEYKALIGNPLFADDKTLQKAFRKSYIKAFQSQYEFTFGKFMESLQAEIPAGENSKRDLASYHEWNLDTKWEIEAEFVPKRNSFPAALQKALKTALEVMEDEAKFAQDVFGEASGEEDTKKAKRELQTMMSTLFISLVGKFSNLIDSAHQADPLYILTFVHMLDAKIRLYTETDEDFLVQQCILCV